MNFDEIVTDLKIYTLAEDYSGYNSPFWSQHGISFLIEANYNERKKRFLFDAASYSKPILFNAKILDLKLKTIDLVVLSHGHYDHIGGLLGIMKKIGKEIPVFAHPNIFKVSFAVEPEFMYAGVPLLEKSYKEKVEKYGGIWVLSNDPIQISPGLFTLGEIEKNEKINFEKDTTINLYKLKNGKIIKDEIEDELGIGIVTTKGLIVIGACSHPGIVSMVKKAMKVSGIDKVYAVIGGLHLIDADYNRIKQTVGELKKIGVKKIYTGHCTGLKAESLFLQEFGDDFNKLHSGKIMRF